MPFPDLEDFSCFGLGNVTLQMRHPKPERASFRPPWWEMTGDASQDVVVFYPWGLGGLSNPRQEYGQRTARQFDWQRKPFERRLRMYAIPGLSTDVEDPFLTQLHILAWANKVRALQVWIERAGRGCNRYKLEDDPNRWEPIPRFFRTRCTDPRYNGWEMRNDDFLIQRFSHYGGKYTLHIPELEGVTDPFQALKLVTDHMASLEAAA